MQLETQQQIFDYVVSNLIKQGRKSVDENQLYCRYRGVGGAKCAAGWLIPDELYDPESEGLQVGSCYNRKFWPPIINDNTMLVRHLQSAHDSANVDNFTETFKRNARSVARAFDLAWKFD